MRLGFDTRIGDVVDFDFQAHLFAGSLNLVGEVEHGKLLGELIEHAEFARRSRVRAGDLNAANRVANVEEAPSLATLSIYRERMSHRSLRAETI